MSIPESLAPGVAVQWQRLAGLAASVAALPLPLAIEPCPQFEPCPTRRDRPTPTPIAEPASEYPSEIAAIATAIRQGTCTARAGIEATLAAIAQGDRGLNCFTAVFAAAALAAAEQVDRAIAQGQDPGPLAGVPFAVKNLFAVAGISTLAGSKIEAEGLAASCDATAIARLKAAGAILVGTLNMDEYAYGFVTENAHYGPTRNPHDVTRMAGGSSGGSAAAVAAGLLPFSLGSDTNGSIRVPAALCGVWGLKPTYGRVSRAGVFPLATSLDHVGPLARSVADLALLFDVLQGPDPRDLSCSDRPVEPTLPQLELGMAGLRVAIATGYFQDKATAIALEALERVTQTLGVTQTVVIPEAERARAAAFVITASEAGSLHLPNLRQRPQDFDPATVERLMAGALIPATWVWQAQRFRCWFRDRVLALFETVDVILAPTTPCVAPPLGQTTIVLGGEEILVRPFLGMYTQPLSFIGLPVVSVPVRLPGALPLGVQMIGAPYQEAKILRLARAWENHC